MNTSRPRWLQDGMQRVENLLLHYAGDSLNTVVSEASTHLIRAGGKRVRPALVLVTSRAGQDGRGGTDLAAAAIELVHIATLYHDDVLDETDTRRGVPTVHSKWGIEVAVLTGDFLFARGSALGAEAGGEVPGILAGAIAEVCEGQIVETGSVGDARRSVDEYMQTIRRKTAALFRAACELGAATSDADPGHRAALCVYGEKLGLAFQIVDDVLDLVGDPKSTGKIPGTDLREGVYTLPVLMACEREPQLIERLMSGDRELNTIMPKLESTGALAASLEMASGLAGDAAIALAELPASGHRDILEALIEEVLAQVPDAAVA
ncbi:MAG: polyprenyl synthetase family protein [Actinomycetota bacterium]|nr:polyprenyl synthetase family protein [Actinomycetota bacterium]